MIHVQDVPGFEYILSILVIQMNIQLGCLLLGDTQQQNITKSKRWIYRQLM